MSAHSPQEGLFTINKWPSLQPPPPLAAGAIDQTRPRELWSWTPAAQFPSQFRSDGALSFWCFRTRAGHRVFFPEWPWAEFLRIAARYGVAALDATDSASAQYHAVMLLFAEKARHTAEFLSRHFGSLADLQATGMEGRGVLPGGLGIPPGGHGRGWTCRELITEGSRILVGTGSGEPTAAECIAHGLHSAATINPVSLPSVEGRREAIRAALFSDPYAPFPDGQIPVDLLEEAAVAIADIYRGRAERDPHGTDDALRVLAGSGAKDHLLALIRGRVTRRTDYAPAQIDAALNEWAWRSLRYAGAALSAAAGRFVALAEACGGLSAPEVSLFRMMYTCHEMYGGLTLPSLFDRFDVIDPWLEQVVAMPDNPRLEVFYTLLGYYAAMARERRAVDMADARPAAVCGTDQLEVMAASAADPASFVDDCEELDFIAGQVAGAFHYACCGQPKWAGRAGESLSDLRVQCVRCGQSFRPDLSLQELQAIALGGAA